MVVEWYKGLPTWAKIAIPLAMVLIIVLIWQPWNKAASTSSTSSGTASGGGTASLLGGVSGAIPGTSSGGGGGGAPTTHHKKKKTTTTTTSPTVPKIRPATTALAVYGTKSVGSTIGLAANESGLSGPVQYQYWYQTPDGVWHQSGHYSSANTFSFTPSAAGTYKVVAYARSASAPLGESASQRALYERMSTPQTFTVSPGQVNAAITTSPQAFDNGTATGG